MIEKHYFTQGEKIGLPLAMEMTGNKYKEGERSNRRERKCFFTDFSLENTDFICIMHQPWFSLKALLQRITGRDTEEPEVREK